ncbi:unnamed protein product, partial [Allacma fusca]
MKALLFAGLFILSIFALGKGVESKSVQVFLRHQEMQNDFPDQTRTRIA